MSTPEILTTWHITFGTHGSRLHGGERPTVDRRRNKLGQVFEPESHAREQHQRSLMCSPPVLLTHAQRECVEAAIPELCSRGGWELVACAAQGDHVHVLCKAPASVHGKQARKWLKRWLTQRLNERFTMQSWWAEGGSTKVVGDDAYLANAVRYITRQQTLRKYGECVSSGEEPGRHAPARLLREREL
jgi:REP element-mobilizing transposase RayT